MRDFDRCRLLRHAWDEYNPSQHEYKTRRLKVIHLRCVRCGTTRHDAIDVNGNLSQRSYSYPEGYAYKRDDRPTTEQLRLAMVKTPTKGQEVTDPEAILEKGTRVWHKKYGNGEVDNPALVYPEYTIVKFQTKEKRLRVRTSQLVVRD